MVNQRLLSLLALLFLALLATPARAQNPFSQWSQGRPSEAAPHSPGATPPPPGQMIPPAQLSSAATTLENVFAYLNRRETPLRVNIWFPGIPNLTETEVAQGAAIAQAIALRIGDQEVIVSGTQGIAPGCFNVVVGDVHQLRSMLSPTEAAAVSNGYLLLRRASEYADTHTLLITGRNASGVNSAILTLGIARERLPQVPTAAIREVFLPAAPPFLRREPLRPETTYSFEQLQETGASIEFIRASRNLRLEFMLPGNYANGSPGSMRLDLHYSGATTTTLGGGARVGVSVNGSQPIEAPSVAVEAGQLRAGIDMPLSLFRPGRNRVEVTFQRTHEVEPMQLYNTSSLSLPLCTAPPILPNLDITSRTAYPFVGQPDGSEIAVFLADRHQETIDATWTIMAKLGQTSNTLLYAAEYLFSLNATSRHIIAVGSRRSLPEPLLTLIPKLVFDDPAKPTRVEVEGTNLKEAIVLARTGVREKLSTATPTPIPENTPPPRPKKERGFLGSAPPVENQHGWLILITADTPPLLRTRSYELVTDGYWDRLEGESVFWSDLPNSLTVYRDMEQKSLAGIQIGLPDTQVEMPLGERYSLYAWSIAVILSFVLFIGGAYHSITRTNYNRNNLTL